MISILIPEYNFDCTGLVEDLHEQCMSEGIRFEIIVMDDASKCCIENNRKISSLSFCSFLESPENLGRARIRNKLADTAKYDYLLFIDCDAKVSDKSFIKKYIESIGTAHVIVGGVGYSTERPEDCKYLRWLYGLKRESSTARIRENEVPRISFNFLIEKEVIKKYPFDESFTGYGHEDKMMGYMLKKNGIEITNIDNSLIHTGLDDNKEFISKSLKAVEAYFTNPEFKNEDSVSQIKIFRVFGKIKRLKLDGLLGHLYSISGNMMASNLCSRHPSLRIFDFYRLCYLSWLYANHRKAER